MYIHTYIRNKNCHQYSYGFQNFMSSWGSWSKISKLHQVGDFSFFGNKSSLLVSTVSFNYVFTLTVHRYGIHKPIYIIKVFTNILMGFKIWCQVSKFDVKLGVVVKKFKNTTGRWLFVFYSKNSLLQGVILNQFSTKQPQCPSGVQWKPLRRGAKRRVWWDGWTDGTGWTVPKSIL